MAKRRRREEENKKEKTKGPESQSQRLLIWPGLDMAGGAS
jgi:hypothetical protein